MVLFSSVLHFLPARLGPVSKAYYMHACNADDNMTSFFLSFDKINDSSSRLSNYYIIQLEAVSAELGPPGVRTATLILVLLTSSSVQARLCGLRN